VRFASVLLALAAAGCETYLVRASDFAHPAGAVAAERESDHKRVAIDPTTARRTYEQPRDGSLVRVGGRSRATVAGWITMTIGGVMATLGTAFAIAGLQGCNLLNDGACSTPLLLPGIIIASLGDVAWILVGPITLGVGAAKTPRELPLGPQVTLRF
jgi:hypothetical protein